jgi:hypothetical protein
MTGAGTLGVGKIARLAVVGAGILAANTVNTEVWLALVAGSWAGTSFAVVLLNDTDGAVAPGVGRTLIISYTVGVASQVAIADVRIANRQALVGANAPAVTDLGAILVVFQATIHSETATIGADRAIEIVAASVNTVTGPVQAAGTSVSGFALILRVSAARGRSTGASTVADRACTAVRFRVTLRCMVGASTFQASYVTSGTWAFTCHVAAVAVNAVVGETLAGSIPNTIEGQFRGAVRPIILLGGAGTGSIAPVTGDAVVIGGARVVAGESFIIAEVRHARRGSAVYASSFTVTNISIVLRGEDAAVSATDRALDPLGASSGSVTGAVVETGIFVIGRTFVEGVKTVPNENTSRRTVTDRAESAVIFRVNAMNEGSTGTLDVLLVARLASLVTSTIAANAVGTEVRGTVWILVTARAQRQVRQASVVAVTAFGAIIIRVAASWTIWSSLHLFGIAVCRWVAAAFLGHGFGIAARVIVDGCIGTDVVLATFVEARPLAVSRIGTWWRFVVAVRAVERLSAAVALVAAEAVLAMTGNTIGGLVTNLAIGQVGEADIIAVGGGITLGVLGTGIRATAVVLDLGAVADDVLVVAASGGQQVRATLRVIADGGAHASELQADRTDLRALAIGRTIAGRSFKVVGWATLAIPITAIPAVTAVAVGTVSRDAVRQFVALAAIGNVGQTDGVTVSPIIT